MAIQVQPDPVRRWLGAEYARAHRGKGWYPQTQTQFDALENPADILLLSGTAGSLKTSTMLVDGIQDRDSPKMTTYFFRKTYPAMEDAMRQAHEIFPQLGFRSVDSHSGFTRTWRAPAGGTFAFRQLMNRQDLDNNWGKEISCALFDEASQWEEEYIRIILTRNRSSDPDLKIRARLGTNPGNIGMVWIMKMFFNGVCPHCEPRTAPPQNVLRWDATWPVAGTKLEDPVSGTKLSTSYILGSIKDHDLLGNSYIARLRMQSPTLAAALEAGCWREFEGQYFDIWNPAVGSVEDGTMVVRRQTARAPWWVAAWSGSDYGYSGSAAASVLFIRTEPILPNWPNGRVLALDEYPCDERGARKEPVREFAQNVYEAFFKKKPGDEQARRIEANYLGVDSWNDRGDLHTLAGQMNEVLDPYGLAFDKADNDRAGGAQLIYAMLKSGEFGICDSCPNTIESIQSRVKDPKEPVKVFNNIGDPLSDYYDACRYGLYSHHQRAMKPRQMRVDERVTELWKTSPIQAMMQAQAIEYEERKREGGDQGQYYGGNIRQRLAEEAAKNKRPG